MAFGKCGRRESETTTYSEKFCVCSKPLSSCQTVNLSIRRKADDFRIFCRTKIAITQWLKERLNLEVSQEKTRVVNVKHRYCEFLGFKIKVHSGGKKQLGRSHISDKQLTEKRKALVEQVKRIRNPRPEKGQLGEIFLFNKMVMGIQNYYQIATAEREENLLRPNERATANRQCYVISPMSQFILSARCNSNQAPVEAIDEIKLKLFRQPLFGRSIEYVDNRISLYSARISKDGTPYALKDACTVWSGGKGSDYFKALPVTISRIHCQGELCQECENYSSETWEVINRHGERIQVCDDCRAEEVPA